MVLYMNVHFNTLKTELLKGKRNSLASRTSAHAIVNCGLPNPISEIANFVLSDNLIYSNGT